MHLRSGTNTNHVKSNFEKLPTEMIKKILMFLPHKDLCNVVLTSTLLREVASEPKMWSEMKCNGEKIHKDGLHKFFSINRFKKVWKINLDLSFPKYYSPFATTMLCYHFNAIAASNSVKELKLRDFENIPICLLERVVSNLEKINVTKGKNITMNQSLALMRICISSSTLIDVNFEKAYLRHVPPELLAQAVGNLQKVNLGDTEFKLTRPVPNLTNEQYLAVIKVCITSSKLKHLSLEGANLEHVPAKLLGQAVKNLNTVNLGLLGVSSASLFTDQSIAVLEACISSSSLTDVSLAGHELEDVPAEVLSKGVGHLQKVNLGVCDMTGEQYLKVLEVCTTSSTLIDLNLSHGNLDQVPVRILAEAASNLQTLDLSYCHLNTDQCIAVLESTHFSSMLKNVSLKSNNLTEVPIELMTQAAFQFKTLNVSGCFPSQNFELVQREREREIYFNILWPN